MHALSFRHRGNQRQVWHWALALWRRSYRSRPPHPEKEVSVSASASSTLPVPSAAPAAAPADRSLAASLAADGYRPYRAPSVRAHVIDLTVYEGQPCERCWEPALVATPWMRHPDYEGERLRPEYVVLLECQHCRHQQFC